MERKTVLHFLPASGGDFFWLRYGTDESAANLIIDTGMRKDYLCLKRIMEEIEADHQVLDALILTHIDDDHIGGFFRWLKTANDYPPIKTICFNTGDEKKPVFNAACALERGFKSQDKTAMGDYGVATAHSILEFLADKHLDARLAGQIVIGSPTMQLPFGATIRFISPSSQTMQGFIENWEKEARASQQDYAANTFDWENLDDMRHEREAPDQSVSNGASLAFLFDYEETHIAFLGDAFADVCVEGLKNLGYSEVNPYQASLIKLSHHGSARNLSDDLLKILSGNSFLMSSSSSKLSRTQKRTVAKLLVSRRKITVYTNFSLPNGFLSNRDRSIYIDTGKLQILFVDGAAIPVTNGLYLKRNVRHERA